MSLVLAARLLRTAVVVLLPASAGCSSDGKGAAAAAVEMPTGSTCPSGSTLTYDGFAKGFMEAYCTRCHSSTLQGAARNDAPLGHDFDSEKGILVVAEHVDERAAAGPNATNEIMPPSAPKPSAAERRKLGEWLACAMTRVDAGSDHVGDAGSH
jgi:uncharacterized membrane protein